MKKNIFYFTEDIKDSKAKFDILSKNSDSEINYLDNSFFVSHDYSDFNSCDIKVKIELVKKTTVLELHITGRGLTNINCTLSNEPFDFEVNSKMKLLLKFGDKYDDSNDELIKFSKSLEEVCINCVETGSMTKDLAILIDKNQKYLTTNQFLDAIDGNLKKKLS